MRLKILGKHVDYKNRKPSDRLSCGFSTGNPALLAAVNRTLEGMKRDGSGARLARKWNVPFDEGR